MSETVPDVAADVSPVKPVMPVLSVEDQIAALVARVAELETAKAAQDPIIAKFAEIGLQAAGVLDTMFYKHPSRKIYQSIAQVPWVHGYDA